MTNQNSKQIHVAGAKRGKTRVNESRLVVFTSDWLRNWREFFKSITTRCNANPKQMRIRFSTQVKTVLTGCFASVICRSLSSEVTK